jgi:hypothetical protein
MRSLCCATLLVCAGCAGAVVSLDSAIPVTDTTPRAVPLEVITRSAAPDPLAIEHGNARVSGLEVSLGHAVSTAVVAWADAHRNERPEGWQLAVEITRARAERSLGGVVTVALNVRATLRTRVGNTYLAQTQAHCLEHRPTRVEQSAPLFYGCMMSVGRELAGWLGGVQP